MMLRIIVIGALLAAAWSIRADDERLATLRVGTEVYSNVTVTSVSVTDIFFTHSRGVGNAKLKNLDPAVQKMFHFDPAKSAAQQAEQAKANALFLNQAAPSLQIEKWLTDQQDTSTTDVLAQSNALPEIAAM